MVDITVTNLDDSGAGSLRAAIEAANALSGTPVTINFAVSGTITLASDLPDVTNSVTIDGTSAPGYAGPAPVVGIDAAGHAGLTFSAGSDSSKLLGISIGDASGAGVTLAASHITVASDYIGLATDGTALGNGGDGLLVTSASSDNLIGLNPNADVGVVSNVISNNAGNGITLDGSSGNTLVDNRVGTDPTGTTAMANGQNGIWVTGGSNGNVIGGTAYTDPSTGTQNDPTGDKGSVTPTFVVPPLGNLVSGNAANGILIDNNSQNNVLNGNFVGTTADGNSALGNALDGVAINGANNNELLGCTFKENPFVYYNVISGNGENGLHVTNSDNVTVQANFFGIGADNATVVGNVNDGILVDGTSSNVQVGGVIPLGNVSAGNGANGIEVAGSVSGFTTFNTFGGLFAFGGAAPNGNDGLLITATGGHQTVQTNVFSGNSGNGIEIGGNASGVTVDPNIVGMTTNGKYVLANGGDGLLIDGTAHDNVIGGQQLSVIPQNIFSGNDGYGVAITDATYNNSLLNSYVGVNVTGEVAAGNGQGGILIGGSSTGNLIGGVTATPENPDAVIVSANTGNGITLENGTSDTTVLNNIIGYGADGQTILLNSGVAVATNASTGNTIESNLIACFAAGTRLRARRGEVPVEQLTCKDELWTKDGRFEPIRWIGHRRIDCVRHADPLAILPLRIRAHAFGPGCPYEDIRLSPDHAIFFRDVLIPVRYLLDEDAICRETVREVTYFHVELPHHAVVSAAGLPAESYLDTGDRTSFAEAEGATLLHPRFGAMRGDVSLVFEALGCAPLQVTGPRVAEARALLERRALRGRKRRRA